MIYPNEGDTIYISIDGHPMNNWEMIVSSVNNDGIVALDGWNTEHLFNHDEYKTRLDRHNVKPKDKIIPLHRTKGTQQPFYVVIETTEFGVKFVDDNNEVRVLGADQLKKLTDDNVWDVLIDLSNEVRNLKQVVRETSNLVIDDIKHGLDKLDIY